MKSLRPSFWSSNKAEEDAGEQVQKHPIIECFTIPYLPPPADLTENILALFSHHKIQDYKKTTTKEIKKPYQIDIFIHQHNLQVSN